MLVTWLPSYVLSKLTIIDSGKCYIVPDMIQTMLGSLRSQILPLQDTQRKSQDNSPANQRKCAEAECTFDARFSTFQELIFPLYEIHFQFLDCFVRRLRMRVLLLRRENLDRCV
jgi:hypothetical protein